MSEDLKAKLRWGIEELFNKANIDLLGELYAENIVVRRPPFPDTAGLAAVREDTANRYRAFPDWHYTIDELIAEGNVTVARLTGTGTHTGRSTNIPISPTGKQITGGSCVVCRWADGKIVEVLEYNDYLGTLQQLGVIPPMGQGGR